MADLITIQMLTRFLKKPVYWFGIMAVPFFLLGSALIGFSVFEYSRSTEHLFIVPAISFLVLSTAYHFIVQGLLAEYIVSTGETDRISIIAFESLKMGEARYAKAGH
jgi:peptidoglycan/LPS O-acetylase OafA/YrhL